jgi:MFS transporter, DHA3 family, macrolide efflux protein
MTAQHSSSLVRNREFVLLWVAQAISSFGDALTNLALIAVVNQLTGSTAAIATLTILVAVPTVSMGLIAGALVDRLNRKTTMVVSDAIRAVLVLGLVLGLVLVSSQDRLWLIYTLSFLQAAVGTFFNPARGALLGKVVPAEQMVQASSLTQTTQVIASLLGTTMAGVLIGGNHSESTFWIVFGLDALTFAISAVLVALLRTSGAVQIEGSPTNPRAVLKSILEGLRLIGQSPTLLAIMVSAMIAVFGFGAFDVLMVPFMTRDLHIPLTWFGALELASTVGLISAGALSALLASRLKFNVLIGGGLLVLALATFPMSLVVNVWGMIAVSFALTFFSTPLNISIGAFIQAKVPNEILGRVGASLNVVIQSSSLLSMAFSGVLAANIGVRGVFVFSAALCALAGVYALIAFRNESGEKNSGKTA